MTSQAQRQEAVAGNLLRLRTDRSQTQRALAISIGVDTRAIQRWEKKIAMPTPGNLARLAHALDVSIDDLTQDPS